MLAPPPDPRHPAFVFAALVAAACVVVSVSWVLWDTDVWQHLAVGRAIWRLHAIPTRQLWTWPTYGAPDVNASWGFRALIWPLWNTFGWGGLTAWRWLSTLAVFGLLWKAARCMGAKGYAPFVVVVLCSLVYRQRSQIRPETLVAVLLAAQLWILELRRAAVRRWREARAAAGAKGRATSSAARADRPADPRLWLVIIALLWANTHISYWIGIALQGIYLVGAREDRNVPVATPLERLRLSGRSAPLAILAFSLVASLINPWGWRALWQPFEYFLYWRHEPIFKTIGELQPIVWRNNALNGLPVIMAGWAALALWRARVRGVDRAEWMMFALFLPLALSAQRFLGFFALVAVPFLARDLDLWERSLRGRRAAPARGPVGEGDEVASFGSLRWAPALLTAAICAAVGLAEWSRADMRFGLGVPLRSVPVRACDFIEAHGVRGRGFNQFAEGGYMVYRFWPDRSRLPFMDIHQAGTRQDRDSYAWAMQDSLAWRAIDTKYQFDYVLLFTHQNPADYLIETLNSDRDHWAMVFTDDVGTLFLRRSGPLGPLARKFEYGALPAGKPGIDTVMTRCESDSSLRRIVEADLRRTILESPWNARSKALLAGLLFVDGLKSETRRLLDEAIRQDAGVMAAHEYRAEIALADGRPRAARDDYRSAISYFGEDAFLDAGMARASAALGDRRAARTWYERAIQHDPRDPALKDSLARLEALR